MAARNKVLAMRKEKADKRKFDEKIGKPFSINPIQIRIRLWWTEVWLAHFLSN